MVHTRSWGTGTVPTVQYNFYVPTSVVLILSDGCYDTSILDSRMRYDRSHVMTVVKGNRNVQ